MDLNYHLRSLSLRLKNFPKYFLEVRPFNNTFSYFLSWKVINNFCFHFRNTVVLDVVFLFDKAFFFPFEHFEYVIPLPTGLHSALLFKSQLLILMEFPCKWCVIFFSTAFKIFFLAFHFQYFYYDVSVDLFAFFLLGIC